jgi:hypothetical protein
MVLGPTELQGTLTQGEKDQVAQAEKLIDAGLRRSYRGDRETTITLPGYPNLRVASALRKMYRDAGWEKVVFEDDQRDGAYVALTRPTGAAFGDGP